MPHDYNELYNGILKKVASNIESYLFDITNGCARIDRVSTRVKTPSSFEGKANKIVDGKKKYNHPYEEIQDIVGARILVLFDCDVEKIKKSLESYLTSIEVSIKEPEAWKFGYFGVHYIFKLPEEAYIGIKKHEVPIRFFELQIKTLFQHAWSETEHDIGYKVNGAPLTLHEERVLAFTSAQAWGADKALSDLIANRDPTSICS